MKQLESFFPTVLAGPIIRRADPKTIFVWVCTSKPLALGLRVFAGRADVSHPSFAGKAVYRDRQASPVIGYPNTVQQNGYQNWEGQLVIGEGLGSSVQLGNQIYVTLLQAKPLFGREYPRGTEISYELFVMTGTGGFNTAELLLDERERGLLTVDESRTKSPSFCLQSEDPRDLRAAFGSCRKFHGDSADQTTVLYKARYGRALATDRPNALFLLGDQIYADDVSDVLIRYISSKATAAFGYEEVLPGGIIASNIGLGDRQTEINDAAHLTSTDAGNHLATFGEFSMMYLMAFNGAMWPDLSLNQQGTGFADKQLQILVPTYDGMAADLEILQAAKDGSYAMRRILANTPTYMIGDDHEVTDDWFITNAWRKEILANPLGARIIGNAVAAYWLFQGWGNDPAAPDSPFVAISKYAVMKMGIEGSNDDVELLDLARETLCWTFVAPTTPPTLFLDTRFGRENSPLTYYFEDSATVKRNDHPFSRWEPEPSELGDVAAKVSIPFSFVPDDRRPHGLNEEDVFAPSLIGPRQVNYALKILEQFDCKSGLILATPAPVFGLVPVEEAKQWPAALKEMVEGTYQAFMYLDYEPWSGNPYSIDLLMQLLEAIPSEGKIRILSGDVHFSYSLRVHLEFRGKKGASNRAVELEMITSSAIKNPASPRLVPAVLTKLGELTKSSRQYYWRRVIVGPVQSTEPPHALLFADYDTKDWDYFFETSLVRIPVLGNSVSLPNIVETGTFGYLSGNQTAFLAK